MRGKWSEIALGLGFDEDRLDDEIDTNNGMDEACLQDCVEKWVSRLEPSWERLSLVLSHDVSVLINTFSTPIFEDPPQEPVSGDMITALVERLGSNPTLSDLRLVAACLLAFSAFLRYDELSKLRCCDITFNASHMVIRISSSKTDQYRQGDNVVVARTGSSKCPVTMLEREELSRGESHVR